MPVQTLRTELDIDTTQTFPKEEIQNVSRPSGARQWRELFSPFRVPERPWIDTSSCVAVGVLSEVTRW
jgi:hypothetical protein